MGETRMSKQGKHAPKKVQRSIGAGAVIAALAAGGFIATMAVGGSGASVNPTNVYTNSGTGVAGYYAAPNADRTANGDHMTGVRVTIPLTSSLESTEDGSYPAVGPELCQFKALSATGYKVVLYAQWNSTAKMFNIEAGFTASGSCLSGLIDVGTPTLIDQIPAGDSVFLAITQGRHGTVYLTDEDVTTDTGGSTTVEESGYFNRAGIGTDADANALTAPATVALADFSKAAVRDTVGWANINRRKLTRLVLTPVTCTTDGTANGGVLLQPDDLGTNSFWMFSGELSS
jgi:hypothetical protein